MPERVPEPMPELILRNIEDLSAARWAIVGEQHANGERAFPWRYHVPKRQADTIRRLATRGLVVTAIRRGGPGYQWIARLARG